MADQIADFEIEGTDPRDAYKQYEGAFDEFIKSRQLEERVRKGEYVSDLPKRAQKEARFITGKRKWVNGELEVSDYDKDLDAVISSSKPDDLHTLYPSIQAGVERTKSDLDRASSQDLEAIIKATPDKKLEGLMKYLSPIELEGKYRDLSRLDREVRSMGALMGDLEGGKDGKTLTDNKKEKIISEMRKYVEDYYKTNPTYTDVSEKSDGSKEISVKPGKQVALGVILDTIKYSDRFVLSKFKSIYDEKSKELKEKLKDDAPGYVRESLMKWKDVEEDKKAGIPNGQEYVKSLYEQLFTEKYKQEGQE